MKRETTFGERLTAWCSATGVNQAELARRCEVTNAAVSQWVSGETNPSAANQRKIVEAFDVSMAEFWGPLPVARAS